MLSQRVCLIGMLLILAAPVRSFAQEHQHDQGAASTLFTLREGSGTAWLPETSDMYGLHRRAGSWELMFHGNAFLQLLHEGANGDRGATQVGSINWFMAMARRPAGGATIGLRGMFSLEPATIRGCGYPDLLATGEQCDGESIHDRQHPHDLLMEVAAEYERPLVGSLRWQIYAGLAGEPALGPVAYPHRLSALPNPIAPIAHHWLDATHITYGVVTSGVFTSRWKAEASIFNGREPDEERWDLDLAALDSFSLRVSFAPHPDLLVQISAGHLNEGEAGEGTLPRIDVDRVTASLAYHRRMSSSNLWTNTVAWGRNAEEGTSTHAFLAETSVTLDERDVWFGRLEIAGKEAHDLHVEEFGDEVFTVGKLQGGYTRYLAAAAGWRTGVGGYLSAGFVPEALKPHYGNRANLGVGFFLTVRPAASAAHSGHTTGRPAGSPARTTDEHAGHQAPAATPQPAGGSQTRTGLLPPPATDLASLKCRTSVDPKTALRMLHQGRMYYFCSDEERAAFAKDPTRYALPTAGDAAEHKH
jgi:YHS domain-containing protein